MTGPLQVEAERLALKLGKELGLDVVTILPNFVLGPIFSETTNGVSVGFLKVGGELCRGCSNSAGQHMHLLVPVALGCT